MLCHLCGASESVTTCHLDVVRTARTRNPEVLRITQRRLLLFLLTPAQHCPLPLPGGPSPAPLHPKRSPTSTGEAELKEERLPGRKASCSAAGSGSRGLPPSSPMVSSAHNPNKAEIPERRKDSTSTPVSWGGAGGMAAGPPPACGPARQCQLGHISRTPSFPTPPGPQTTALGSVTSFRSFTQHTCIEDALCLSLYSILVYKVGFSVQKNFSVLST